MAGRTFKEFCEQNDIRVQINAADIDSIEVEEIYFLEQVEAQLKASSIKKRSELKAKLEAARQQKVGLARYMEDEKEPKYLIKVRIETKEDLFDLARFLYHQDKKSPWPELLVQRYRSGNDSKWSVSALAFQVTSTTISTPTRWLTYEQVVNEFHDWDEQLNGPYTAAPNRVIVNGSPLTNAELLALALTESELLLGVFYDFEASEDTITMRPKKLLSGAIRPQPIEDRQIAKIIVDTLAGVASHWINGGKAYLKFESGQRNNNADSVELYPTDVVDGQQPILVTHLVKHLEATRHLDPFSPHVQDSTKGRKLPRPRRGSGTWLPDSNKITPTGFVASGSDFLKRPSLRKRS